MIILSLLIIWLGNKRGMNYRAWLIGYLALSAIGVVLRVCGGNVKLEYVLAAVSVNYSVAFFFWPVLASDGQKKAMAAQVKAEATEAKERAEKFYRSLDGWLPLKVYTDSSQVYELQADRTRLDDLSITSFAKTAGITTLFVAKEDFEKAAAALGVEPVEEVEPSG